MKTYLGIDLHKRVSTWTLIDANRNVLLHKQTVLCTPNEIQKTINKLPTPTKDMQVAVEPVCGWRWVIKQLEASGMDVHVANPLQTRLIADSRIKNDSIDAKKLAELLRADFLPTSYVAPDDIVVLRSLIRERAYLVHTRTGVKNRLKALIDAKGIHELRDTCLQKSRREAVLALGDAELSNLLTLIIELDNHIAPLDKRIQAFARADERTKLLMTIPVVGPITATTIIAEVGDFSRFKKAKHLASYAGLIPSQRSSAGIAKHGRITKVGSKYLRSALVESAMRFREQHNPALWNFYQRVRKNSSPMKARIALARKLACISWHMVKNNEPFHSLSSEDSTKRGDSELLSNA